MLSTFHAGSNKPHLLANRDALPALGRALSSGDAQLRLNAASALWALVFDNQKAKAVVKPKAKVNYGRQSATLSLDCQRSTTLPRKALQVIAHRLQDSELYMSFDGDLGFIPTYHV